MNTNNIRYVANMLGTCYCYNICRKFLLCPKSEKNSSRVYECHDFSVKVSYCKVFNITSSMIDMTNGIII